METARVRQRFAPHPTDDGHRVTTLELFFDLVFVYAVTQITAYVAADLEPRRVLEGLVLIAMLWFAWCSYAWLGNQAHFDVGLVRAVVLTSMGALFLVGLAVPEAFRDEGGPLSAPLVLAVALAVVRLAHVVTYLEAAYDDAGLRRQLVITSGPVTLSCALLVLGAVLGGDAQLVLWLVAIAVDYGGIYAGGTHGWRLPAPGHFAERHGLIVIIALGESIVAIGVGVSALPLTGAIALGAVLGLTVTICLWWTYFDVVALVAERVLASRDGNERTSMARDSFTFLHFPMIAGIIMLAVGMKKVMTQVGDTKKYDLADPLGGLALALLVGGVVAYLLGHVAFRLRNIGTLNRQRLVVAAALVVLGRLGADLPALVVLGGVAAVLCGLVAFESVRFRDNRRTIREHHHAHEAQPRGHEGDRDPADALLEELEIEPR